MFESVAAHAAVAVHTGAEAVAGRAPAAIKNPFDGMVPDFTVFGVAFDAWWKKLFVGLWAIAIIIAAVYLVMGLTAMAKSDANNPRLHEEGQKRAKGAGLGLACLAGFGVIVGAILFVAGG